MRMRRGVCYLVEDETSETAYRLFTRLLPELEAGFCLSRLHPEKIRTRFGPANIRIGWFAEVPGEDHFSANAMASVAKAIQQFIEEHGSSGLVLIDGLEYVILHNGFPPTLLAFVEHLNEFTMGTQAVVLIAFRPQTLDPRELALLERNLQVLDGKDVKSQLDIEELGEILGSGPFAEQRSTEKMNATKVLSSLPDMRGPPVDRVRCPKCGTENDDEVAFCVYCGSLLPDHAGVPPSPTAPRAPNLSGALKPIPPVARAFPERRPDFVGLIGAAFFLLIVGIVFTLNTDLLTNLRSWWDLVVAGGLFVRPPDGIITSAIFFFGLLGLSNFLTSGLRWILDRSRFGALARVLAGVGFLSLALLTWRYSMRAISGSLVISIWTAIMGTFLVIYIAVGLYWVRVRRPAPTGARVPASRP
ncbi:MAG: DUF835 domain-containing protein [Methanobacteriota archaeon]|nr:MAG: DUF835 domain-containing protein [Euryarchaeota archaeon]TLZ66335.1 MAG: DUF835 domain-containing protein [Euryarchaeota archaeon]